MHIEQMIDEMAGRITSEHFRRHERDQDNDPYSVEAGAVPHIQEAIRYAMRQAHEQGVKDGLTDARRTLGELLDLPARVQELERREKYRQDVERG